MYHHPCTAKNTILESSISGNLHDLYRFFCMSEPGKKISLVYPGNILKIFYLAVIFNSSSDRCHNIARLPCLLGVGVALITSLYHSTDSPVYLVYGECFVSIHCIHQGFYSLRLFWPWKGWQQNSHLHHGPDQIG